MAKKFTNTDFIEKAINIHGEHYDYSLVSYEQTHKKIDIICNYCKTKFKQTPHSHLSGSGCPICNGKKTTEEFIKQAQLVHNDYYDYSLTNYTLAHNKVKIVCKRHGLFYQKPFKHLNGQGCKICGYKKSASSVLSKKEKLIYDWLKDHNKSFYHQYELITKKVARNSNLIIIDFFVRDHNKSYFIEFDGKQHFEFIPFFHKNGLEDFNKQIRRDNLLEEICNLNNGLITLIKFSYKMSEEYIIKELETIFNSNELEI